MEFENLDAYSVMQRMDQQQPHWWMRWATQNDLIDALDVREDYRATFLKSRCRKQVELVLRSALVE
jgi:hypothetical protein